MFGPLKSFLMKLYLMLKSRSTQFLAELKIMSMLKWSFNKNHPIKLFDIGINSTQELGVPFQ